MNWPERMNAALKYIEANLDGDLDIAGVAGRACCSLYHFHRMFHASFGLTPADYIRRRRLTLAAGAIATGERTILDIALTYGYDSPNAFTRAFRKFHGINPRDARRTGTGLAAFPPLSFPETVSGGTSMDYRIMELSGFDIVGKGARFGVASGEFKDQGRTFWKKFVGTPEYRKLCGLTGGRSGPMTGAYVMTAYLPNETGTWDPVINVFGVEKAADMAVAGFEVFPIPAATYAEFYCPFSKSAATNKRIYAEWFPATGYERDDKPDIAAFYQVPFSAQTYVRWLIPIINKS